MRILNGYLQYNKKQFRQYLNFRIGMTHLNYSLKKLGKTFKLEKELLKTEMNHDETDENNWRDKRNKGVDFVKNDE